LVPLLIQWSFFFYLETLKWNHACLL
jgi:hypothetical protein